MDSDKTIYEIPLEDIEVSDLNVRREDADKDLDELAESIRIYGLIQPVVLRGTIKDSPPYPLIVGQRRYLAHVRLDKPTIRAVFAGRLNDIQAKIRSLAENMLRVPLNHADAAKAVTELYKHYKQDDHRVAKETGMSLQRVRQYIDIEERATDKMKKALRAHKVQPVDVQRVLNAAGEDKDKADRLLDLMDEEGLTSHQKKRMVAYGQADARASAETIVKKAKQPRIVSGIMVTLETETRRGLEKASESLKMDPEEVATTALKQWLSDKGFM